LAEYAYRAADMRLLQMLITRYGADPYAGQSGMDGRNLYQHTFYYYRYGGRDYTHVIDGLDTAVDTRRQQLIQTLDDTTDLPTDLSAVIAFYCAVPSRELTDTSLMRRRGD